MTSEQELIAAAKEVREACAACFRVIYRFAAQGAIDDLEQELKLTGVRDGCGKRLQDAIAKAESVNV